MGWILTAAYKFTKKTREETSSLDTVFFRDLCRPWASKAWALLIHASLSHTPWVQLNGRNVSVALRIDPIHECAQYIASTQPESGQSQHRFSFRLCLEKDFPLLGLLFAYLR